MKYPFVILAVGTLVFAGICPAVTGRLGAEENLAAQPAAKSTVASPSWREAIQAALERRDDFTFVDKPLSEVIQQLRERTKVNIVFDSPILHDAGVEANSTNISFEAQDVALKSALRLLLANCGLNYILQDEVLLITTQEQADSLLETKVYDVADLICDKAGNCNDELLTNLIVGTVATNSWPEGTGPARIGAAHGCLFIEQSSEVHEQIRDLLNALRKMRKLQSGGRFGEILTLNAIPAKLEKLLPMKTSLYYQEIPFSNVIEELKANTRINIVYDSRSLGDSGLDPLLLPVTIDVKNISVRSALSRLCRPLGFSWYIKDDVIVVASKEQADTELEVRVYPIADLAGPHSQTEMEKKLNRKATDPHRLAAEMAGNLRSESWFSGPGTIDTFDLEYPVLVVSHTAEVHEAVAEFLASLRRIRDAQAEALAKRAGEPQEPEKPIQKIYLLKTGEPKAAAMPSKEAAELVKELVAPETWNQEGVSIKAVTGRLIVRQSPSVQREIWKLLYDLDALSATTQNGIGGGFGGGKP